MLRRRLATLESGGPAGPSLTPMQLHHIEALLAAPAAVAAASRRKLAPLQEDEEADAQAENSDLW